MNLQPIYNAVYNHFAEEIVWPQLIQYNPEWEIYLDGDIKKAYESGKRDGIRRKQESKQIKKILK